MSLSDSEDRRDAELRVWDEALRAYRARDWDAAQHEPA